MDKLKNLYDCHKVSSTNPLCDGCSVLTSSKPCYSVEDYKNLPQGKVLFLSDSFRYRFGKASPFSDKEKELIKGIFPYSTVFSSSVKCPSVKEADMSPDDMKICRAHLEATIDAVKPILVFTCGNLAMKMLIKKSGITNKRGKSFEFTSQEGHTCTVVPLFHPFSVIKEPRHKYLFEVDIKNAYAKYILHSTNTSEFKYKVLISVTEVELMEYDLRDTSDTIAVDIETTGLNFLTDKVQTIAISTKGDNWVIPLDHKDSPFIKGTVQSPIVWKALRNVLENPNNKKVFHNAKFDLKFLKAHDINPVNVWDTKVMHHLIDENIPKSLMDLVKLYFSSELEDL